MEQIFYICHHCGNIVTPVTDQCGNPACCGEAMVQLVPNSCGEPEVHIPICRTCGNTVRVTVGAKCHPMTSQHHIEWIFLKTHKGSQHHKLHPGQPPKAQFSLCAGDQVQAAYAYCNLHGLWKG